MAPPVIVLDRVAKRFAGHTAVDALSLEVSAGLIYGLLGPNGAGKTTTIRMIMGIMEPDEGAARLFGDETDIGAGARDHAARSGCLPAEGGLSGTMPVRA